MRKTKSWLPAFTLIIVALLFSCLAIFTPWWNVKSGIGAEKLQNYTVQTDYRLDQTVTSTHNNRTVIVPLTNMTIEQNSRLASTFYTTYILHLTGTTLTALSVAVIFISGFYRPSDKLTLMVTTVAGILLFITPIYLQFSFTSTVSQLKEVIPTQVLPPTPNQSWIPLPPSKVDAFWGSLTIPQDSHFPEWSQGLPFWNWGATWGWIFTFAASILLFAASIWIQQNIVKQTD